ncbi:GNAT family N-acetyltransferase [Primorskyibacter sp. S187A]|uniref:GNAT family N-acetyltransferase n=1 Tax=Primorskyibacter sp. S187A TaxID=3415130 RepID=UPI003C7AEED4
MTLLDAIEPTWPARRRFSDGPFVLRDGAGGGKRVSAASLTDTRLPTDAELAKAEAKMREMGQTPMFSLAPDQQEFDAALAARGYQVVDPTRVYHLPVEGFAGQQVPRVTAFAVWEPLAIMEDIWAEGGIGPARVAIMHRAKGAKTGILGRRDDTPAGAAFVALHGDVAMLHALEVRARFRRRGLGRWMVVAAAQWAATQGARTLCLLVTDANAPANALYQAMGFLAQPGYHYRVLQEDHP